MRDRLGLLSDLCSTCLQGQEELSALATSLPHYTGQTSWPVLQAVLASLSRLEELVEGTPAWAGFLQLAYRSGNL